MNITEDIITIVLSVASSVASLTYFVGKKEQAIDRRITALANQLTLEIASIKSQIELGKSEFSGWKEQTNIRHQNTLEKIKNNFGRVEYILDIIKDSSEIGKRIPDFKSTWGDDHQKK